MRKSTIRPRSYVTDGMWEAGTITNAQRDDMTQNVEAGVWVADADMHPATNISNRKFRASGNVKGRFHGDPWPTKNGQKPAELFWYFPKEDSL